VGAGKKKSHQSFSVSPTATAVLDPEGGPEAADFEPTIQDLADAEGPLGMIDEVPEVANQEPAPPKEPIVDDTDGPALLDDASSAGGDWTNWTDTAAPVPESPTPGEVLGTPVLVGGADLEGSSATLVSYVSPEGPREVLMATVDEGAEAKLMEALAVSETKMVPIEVEKQITGRLPLDTDNQLHEQLSTVAKSVNHHLHQGDGIPAHTLENLEKTKQTLAGLEAQGLTEADAAMVGAYQGHVEAISARLDPGWAVPYDQGGKVPTVLPYETTGMVKVTEHVPAPVSAAEDPDLCPTTLRDATRIKPHILNGETAWDGKERSKAAGKEYVADLGDGYQAVYRPYAGHNPSADDYSLRGNLEVIAPQGPGHGRALVERLGRLNLVNRPMTKAEGEWAYLSRNIDAQNLRSNAGVAKALDVAKGVDEAAIDNVFSLHAHQAVGMDDAHLSSFAQRLTLEAEASSLPTKVAIVRNAVAKATGHASGAELACSRGYDPTPRRSGGWLTWDRFDVVGNRESLQKTFAGKSLHHHLTSGASGDGGVLAILRNGGALASTERRRRMGAPSNLGMSESADMKSGGSNSVFLRVGSSSSAGASLTWDDPTVLLRRSEWYGYSSDHFGSLNAASVHSTNGLTRDPAKLVGFHGNNEVMFRDGIDLLGAEAPSRIKCGSAKARGEVLAFLKQKGISHLGGKAVKSVVVA